MTERTAIHPLAVVYTVDQFCAMHAISRDTFERLVGRGELAAFKLGRRTYVAKAEAERWLRARPPARPPVLTAGQGGNQRHGAANRKDN
jgi:excisionase family DNA binding protein